MTTETKGQFSADWIDNEKLREQNSELVAVLKFAVENDGGTEYDGNDDYIGRRVCCREMIYKPHKPDCWVVKAKAAIAKAQS